MAKVIEKIRCPYHDDRTASMAIYADGWAHCFGCGKHVKLRDAIDRNMPKEPPEDIVASLDVIQKCGTEDIRGLKLPADEEYYYVVWPGSDYYKKRSKKSSKEFKYLCPKGHRKPLYVHRAKAKGGLLLIEGELNCLTAALQPGFDNYCFASPGPTTDFMRKEYLRFYEKFDKVTIIVDKDAAGVAAGIELKAYLKARGKKVVLLALEEDLNDVYVSKGQKALTQILEKAVAMFRMR